MSRDVATDMADAKAQLDDVGGRRCAECMHVKTREPQAILAADPVLFFAYAPGAADVFAETLVATLRRFD